jgi:S-adenosylmethionine:tRNA ribosyltransferase-isomerase
MTSCIENSDLSLYDYPFPKDLVAQHPPADREDAKMMVLDRANRSWTHHGFREFPNFLRAGDLLILNNAQADLVDMGGRLVPALPPYIKRKKPEDFTQEDFDRYRSVYASAPGSKAAPTAGFHFTDATLEKLRAQGVEIRFLTLHVSDDTFKPIRSTNILEHPMHGETYEIPPETIAAIQKAKAENRRVVAAGTTSVRALESWANTRQPGLTRLFITPGYKFQIVDAMLTNFHRPRSTVLVLVSAFAAAEGGRELILSAYADAIEKRYRLFSYGDCMLIE